MPFSGCRLGFFQLWSLELFSGATWEDLMVESDGSHKVGLHKT